MGYTECMAQRHDAKKILSELERMYALLLEMKERHEAEFNAITSEVVATFRKIRDEHPGTKVAQMADQNAEDPLFAEARRIVIEAGKASTSFLQRKLEVGYSRAARLIEMLEAAGVVGPAYGALPREVYAAQKAPVHVEKVLKKIAAQLKKQKGKKTKKASPER